MCKNRKVIGVLVCYYPEYRNKAIKKLLCILNALTDDYKLLVVNNRNSVDKKEYGCSELIHHEIDGSNKSWEFSAWDEGVFYLRENGLISDSDIIVFANDTFCYHRPFSFYNKWLFVNAFRKLFFNEGLFVGEICQLPFYYTIFGLKANSWISTYLFGVRYKDLPSLEPFDKVGQMINVPELIKIVDKKILISRSSPKICMHLSNWLFPSIGEHGWYKAKNGNLDGDLVFNKLKAIVNEKLLSAQAIGKGLNLYSIYRFKIFIKLINIQSKFFSAKK